MDIQRKIEYVQKNVDILDAEIAEMEADRHDLLEQLAFLREESRLADLPF